MSLLVQPQVRQPPAGLIERFTPQIRAVALTWLTLSRMGLSVQITSWWRDEATNAATPGSARYSQHLVGTAMDGKAVGYSRDALLPIVQRIAAYYGATAPSKGSQHSGSSVHVQGLPVGAVQTILSREPMLIRAAGAFTGPPRPVGV